MKEERNEEPHKSEGLMFRQLESIQNVMMDSLMKNYVPFPIDRSVCSAWTDTLKKGGDTIIYTSFMYQLSSLFHISSLLYVMNLLGLMFMRIHSQAYQGLLFLLLPCRHS